ncbi:hypothetical protein B0H63DRAFT_561445 [Podospora didyma]|uniref:Uncharacterized protein n=1 Tax=Podospora didyma TaxID=330526 RepID=A0AAE0TW56_9PEZI|nr:hypothetical protein B0H63DRAFT_561445 [Podospora didyma]
MPAPQRVIVERQGASSRSSKPQGFVASTYETLTSPDNASVVRSLALFGAAVTFLTSSWSEIIMSAINNKSILSLAPRTLDVEPRGSEDPVHHHSLYNIDSMRWLLGRMDFL